MKRTLIQPALRIAILCLAGLALAPADATAQAILYAVRDGDMIRVDVSVVWSELPAEYVGVVVQRWTVGLCDDLTTVTPAPWPREVRPPQDPFSEYTLLSPVPAENRCLGYAVRAIDADGNLFAVRDAGGMPFDFVSCGLAIVARGFLMLDPYNPTRPPYYEECADGCWSTTSDINLSAVDPATYAAYISFPNAQLVPVDIYGTIWVSDLLPNVQLVATQVVATPSGRCGPLPVTPSSWGQLKRGYR